MPPRDLATIRLVATRYRELQGLRLVLAAAVFLALLAADWFDDFPRPLAALLVCAIWSFAEAYLNHYYSRRFGVVEQPASVMAAIFGLALVISLILSWGTGSPDPMLAVFATAHIWIAVRDFPLRAYHLLGFLSVGAVFASTSIPHIVSLHPGVMLTLYPASLIAIGFLDHHLLATLRVEQSGLLESTDESV